jgi:hypothetical protein
MRANDLARKIELILPAAFANFATNGRTTRTQTAMTVFGDLGHDSVSRSVVIRIDTSRKTKENGCTINCGTGVTRRKRVFWLACRWS